MDNNDNYRVRINGRLFPPAGGMYEGPFDPNHVEESEEPELAIPTPLEIREYLDKHVIGQDYAKKAISTLLVNHMHRAKYNATVEKSTEKLSKSNILLIGDSGVGKTLTVKVAAEFVDVPLVIEDATKLTQEGYVGDSVDTILTSLYIEAGKDVEKAERGIIFLDEFDKLASSVSDRANVSTGAVQQSLLKMVEGGKFQVSRQHSEKQGSAKVEIDTTSITFVFAGAFGGLASKVKGQVSLGFTESTREREILESDIIDYGIMPEILGRIGTYITLHDLSDTDMMKVLTEVENSIVKQYQKLFEIRGIKWKLKKKDYTSIIKKVKETKLGARGLQRQIEQLLLEQMYEAAK